MLKKTIYYITFLPKDISKDIPEDFIGTYRDTFDKVSCHLTLTHGELSKIEHIIFINGTVSTEKKTHVADTLSATVIEYNPYYPEENLATFLYSYSLKDDQLFLYGINEGLPGQTEIIGTKEVVDRNGSVISVQNPDNLSEIDTSTLSPTIQNALREDRYIVFNSETMEMISFLKDTPAAYIEH